MTASPFLRYASLGIEEDPVATYMEGYLQQLVAEKADRYGLRAFAEDAVEVFQRWMEEDEPDDNNPVNRQVMRKVKKHLYLLSFWVESESNYMQKLLPVYLY